MSHAPKTHPLRLLSLDGGGCRAMIQLLLLRHLLKNLEPDTADVDALRPCDYFDVIAGTSAGGLNALLLGRLELSIGAAIQAFSKFTETVFKESGGIKKAVWEGNTFELSRLEEAVDALLGDRANEHMYQPELELACHVGRLADSNVI
jgi:patatin-like phospholipase/acyl hydrolase